MPEPSKHGRAEVLEPHTPTEKIEKFKLADTNLATWDNEAHT